MLNFFNAIVIGFVQGVAEFLPISSSGHLVLVYELFKINENSFALTIFLHMATLFSIIYVYRKDILKLIKHPFCKTNKLLITATIPTVVVALILKKTITNSFNLNFIIFGFIFTALILGIADYLSEKQDLLSISQLKVAQGDVLLKYQSPTITIKNNTIIHEKAPIFSESDITSINISYVQSIVIGLAQGLACFPGISRSGSTIATALILKVNKKDATTFSFLLSIPVILGSMILAIADFNKSGSTLSIPSILVACIVSFVVGIFAINLLNRIVKKQKLSYFSYYLLALVFVILFIKFVF